MELPFNLIQNQSTQNMRPIRIGIVDDHEVFRTGLKLILSDDDHIEFAFEASNGQSMLDVVVQSNVDVVLLDLKMPVMDGFEASIRLHELCPNVKILILSMFEEEQYIIHLMESGANGYLLKNASPSEILAAIHCVHESNYYFNDQVSSALLRNLVNKKMTNPLFSNSKTLNERELQILQFVCQELTAQEIAEKVFLSPRTIEGIKSSMMEKIGVRNVAGLVIYAFKNGLVK